MRFFGLTLLSIGLATAPLGAQQSVAPPIQDPARAKELETHLLAWEQAMQGVRAIQAQCIRIEKDQVFAQVAIFDGVAKFMKPNLAKLEMQKRGDPRIFEKYLFTGTNLYEYHQQTKEIWIHRLPPSKPGQVADDNFLSFLFGMKAEEAMRKYVLNLAGTDNWYVYIAIDPRFPADKADFTKARLTLSKQTYLPRELWFMQPNKNEVKWDIPRIDAKALLDRKEFDYPEVPTGWKMKDAPKPPDTENLQPRVVRPNR